MRQVLSVRLRPDQFDVLGSMSDRTGISSAEHIRRAVDEYLERVAEVEKGDLAKGSQTLGVFALGNKQFRLFAIEISE